LNTTLQEVAARYRRDKGIADALLEANRIAFGPLMFQAARSLLKRGVLAALHTLSRTSCGVDQLAHATGLTPYAIRLLVDAGTSLGLVSCDGSDYRLTKIGFIWLTDETVRVNADFVHDLCYQAFAHFDEAIATGHPAGLRVFGDWATIYPGLTQLPEAARGSWYRFDHHYSDAALPEAIDILALSAPRRVLDIGGNTGRFARALTARLPETRVFIVDLPEQIEQARTALQDTGTEFVAQDMLDADAELPGSFDAVWISQFLDCFSMSQIVDLLRRLRTTVAPGGSLYVMEPCPDDQRFEAATHSLNATSLYFACIANGYSRLYCSGEWAQMFDDAGLRIAERHVHLGICQTLFRCVPA